MRQRKNTKTRKEIRLGSYNRRHAIHRLCAIFHSPGMLTLWSACPGNNYGLGGTRAQELQGSCKVLGIHQERCIVLDHPELQDDPRVWWNTDLIEALVQEHVNKWEVDVVGSDPCPVCFLPLLIRPLLASTAKGGYTDSADIELTKILGASQILTFDEGGVSGHMNHRAVSAAVR